MSFTTTASVTLLEGQEQDLEQEFDLDIRVSSLSVSSSALHPDITYPCPITESLCARPVEGKTF